MNPSDVLGVATFGGIFLFFTWVCFRSPGSFEKFIKGIAWVLVLAVVALVLIAIFQVGYPGH